MIADRMSTAEVFSPTPGKLVARLIGLLTERGSLTLAELAEAAQKKTDSIRYALRDALERDVVFKEARDRGAKRVLVYSLRDASNSHVRPVPTRVQHLPLPVRRRNVPARDTACPITRPHGWASPIGHHPDDYTTDEAL